jgi:Asp-tRNA(Asn)/Glu-tRNA(Gln) amidotransferase C subunit
MDFLFHNISEKEREEIKKQVHSILDSFSKKLLTLKGNAEDSGIEREKCEREESGNPDKLSKEIMFKNAPETNKDFIIGEKKKW